MEATVADRGVDSWRLPCLSLPAIDSLLAAAALTHDLELVTRNVKDFADLPVRVFNPWSDETASFHLIDIQGKRSLIELRIASLAATPLDQKHRQSSDSTP